MLRAEGSRTGHRNSPRSARANAAPANRRASRATTMELWAVRERTGTNSERMKEDLSAPLVEAK